MVSCCVWLSLGRGQIVIVVNPRSVTGFGDDGGRHNWPLVRACDHVGDNGKVGDHNCHLGGLSLPLSWLWRGLGLQDGGNDGNQDHLCQHLPGKVQSTALLVVTKSTFKAQSHLSSWFTSHRQSLAHKNTLHLLHYHTSLFHSADPSIHSSFSPLALGSFHNGAIWQSCCQIAGKAGAPAGRHIAFSFKRQLAPDPHGPFCISIFSKDIKDHKTQDTQTTILPISAIFLVLKVFSCSLLLFCLLLCVTFHWIDKKMIQK